MRGRIPTLELLVFAVGTSTLGAEIAAARLMAPFFGDSTIVWANTIAIVLVALSVGYWFGGRMADRHPHLRGLCMLVIGVAYSACMALAGRYLTQHRHYIFCLVMAALSCAFFPFGTVLGVFTIIVLQKDSVRQLFGRT